MLDLEQPARIPVRCSLLAARHAECKHTHCSWANVLSTQHISGPLPSPGYNSIGAICAIFQVGPSPDAGALCANCLVKANKLIKINSKLCE